MAQRFVTHSARNSRGNVIAIGNPDSEWRQRRSEWAISDILAFLGDGRLLVGGGTDPGAPFPEEGAHFGEQHWSGARECAIYNVDGTWTPAASMRPEPGQETRGGGRWYPTLLTLPDGRILAVGGHPRVDLENPAVTDSRHGAWLPEVYDPDGDAWTYQPGHWLYVVWEEAGAPPQGQTEPESAADRNNYLYYPRLFVVPDGRVFMASRNDGHCGWYDTATGLVDEQTIAPPPNDDALFRETNHTAVLLPLLPGDGYTPHILFFGLEGAHRITLDPEVAEPAWQPTAPRDWAFDQPPVTPGEECPPRPARDWAEEPPLRRHGSATILPTGDVLFTGGIDSTGGAGLPDCDGVLEAELYHPGFAWDAGTLDFAFEEWTTTPPGSVVRNYHSVALLLPNGRVLTSGGNLDGQLGGDGVKERRIEIFCPTYDSDPNRPVLLQAPSVLTYGQTFQFLINRAHRIQRVALIRCSSMTHAWNGDQRYVGLEFENTATGVIEAVAPPNGNIAPPGPYMLWAVDDRDRPCRLAPLAILS